MSVVISSLGSARNSSNVQRLGSSTWPTIEKSHSSRGVRGVGPAERTGKPSTRYWPGGSFVSLLLWRPLKPREKNPSPMFCTSSLSRYYSSGFIDRGIPRSNTSWVILTILTYSRSADSQHALTWSVPRLSPLVGLRGLFEGIGPVLYLYVELPDAEHL